MNREGSVTLGLIPAPDIPEKIAEELASELPDLLRSRVDAGVSWEVAVLVDPLSPVGVGQAPVKRYNRHLRELVHLGKAKPSWIVSHNLSLEEGPDAYEHFDKRGDGWTKVVLHPNGS